MSQNITFFIQNSTNKFLRLIFIFIGACQVDLIVFVENKIRNHVSSSYNVNRKRTFCNYSLLLSQTKRICCVVETHSFTVFTICLSLFLSLNIVSRAKRETTLQPCLPNGPIALNPENNPKSFRKTVFQLWLALSSLLCPFFKHLFQLFSLLPLSAPLFSTTFPANHHIIQNASPRLSCPQNRNAGRPATRSHAPFYVTISSSMIGSAAHGGACASSGFSGYSFSTGLPHPPFHYLSISQMFSVVYKDLIHNPLRQILLFLLTMSLLSLQRNGMILIRILGF